MEREDGLERLVLIGRFSLHLNLELRLDAIGSISVFLLGGTARRSVIHIQRINRSIREHSTGGSRDSVAP